MLEPDPSFRPVRTRDGYLPLEDLGMIGDGSTAALVGLNGSICWLCLPRFDSEPLFCGLLDRERGGHFDIAPDGLIEARQRYTPDTGVLVTELRSATGVVRLTDALALAPARGNVIGEIRAGASWSGRRWLCRGASGSRSAWSHGAVPRRALRPADWWSRLRGGRTCGCTCGPAAR